MSNPRTSISLASATALVVANMIGAGVYTTSGFTLAALGSPSRVLLAWLVGGVIAVCGAISYGALARRFSESGGEYLFLSRAAHPLAGTVAGWVSLLAGFTGAIAFAAAALEAYLRDLPLISEAAARAPAGSIAATAIGIGVLLNALRLRPGVATQDVLVAVKLLLIAVLLGVAASRWPGGWAASSSDGAAALAAAPWSLGVFATQLVWISLSYSGFNAAIYIAGEVERPERNVPRALLIGTLLVTGIYLALNAVFVLAPPRDAVAGAEQVAAVAAEHLAGPRFAQFVTVVITVSLATSIISMLLAGPRVAAKMAADGVLPRVFKFAGEAPTAAVFAQGAAAIVVVFFATLRQLLEFLGFTLSVSAALTVASIFLVRRRDGAEALPVPGYPWPPLIFCAATLMLAAIVLADRLKPLWTGGG